MLCTVEDDKLLYFRWTGRCPWWRGRFTADGASQKATPTAAQTTTFPGQHLVRLTPDTLTLPIVTWLEGDCSLSCSLSTQNLTLGVEPNLHVVFDRKLSTAGYNCYIWCSYGSRCSLQTQILVMIGLEWDVVYNNYLIVAWVMWLEWLYNYFTIFTDYPCVVEVYTHGTCIRACVCACMQIHSHVYAHTGAWQ